MPVHKQMPNTAQMIVMSCKMWWMEQPKLQVVVDCRFVNLDRRHGNNKSDTRICRRAVKTAVSC